MPVGFLPFYIHVSFNRGLLQEWHEGDLLSLEDISDIDFMAIIFKYIGLKMIYCY